MTQQLLDLAIELLIPAFQIALVFGFCGYLVKTFLNMAFGRRWKL